MVAPNLWTYKNYNFLSQCKFDLLQHQQQFQEGCNEELLDLTTRLVHFSNVCRRCRRDEFPRD